MWVWVRSIHLIDLIGGIFHPTAAAMKRWWCALFCGFLTFIIDDVRAVMSLYEPWCGQGGVDNPTSWNFFCFPFSSSTPHTLVHIVPSHPVSSYHLFPPLKTGFGAGGHACRGETFGLMQVKTIVSFLMRNYDFELVSQTMPEPDYTAMVVGPKGHLRVRYRKKADAWF